jgi:DNA-binding PadR family transcriptional regulator
MDHLTTTAACVLGLLDLGPAPGLPSDPLRPGMTGWQLYETAERSLARFWNVTRSQIYSELTRLEELGLVEATGQGGARASRPYRITEAGRSAFQGWLAAWASDEPRDEQLRSPLLLTVFFGDSLPRPVLRRVLLEYRPRYERHLQRSREMLDALGEADRRRPPTAVLRRGIAYREMMVRWIDGALADLDADEEGTGDASLRISPQ